MTKARDLANFTASTGVVDADIGSTVQAYDSNLTSFVNTFTLPTSDGTANQLLQTNGSGTISFTTPSVNGAVLTAVATGTLTNGRMVNLKSDGTVEMVQETTTVYPDSIPAGSTTQFNGGTNATQYAIAWNTSASDQFLLVYLDTDNYGKAVVGTISGTTISFGSETQINGSTPFETPSVCPVPNTGDRYVIVWRGNAERGRAVVASVSGTSVSTGAEVTFPTSTSVYAPCVAANWASSGSVVATYFDNSNGNYPTAVAGSVSGTSISFGSRTVIQSANALGPTAISFNPASNDNKGIVVYLNSSSGNGCAKVISVSGTSVSFNGSQVTWNSSGTASQDYTNNGLFISASPVTSNQYALVDRRSSNDYGDIYGATVSGDSITFSSATTFESSALTSPPRVAFNKYTPNSLVVTYSTSSATYAYTMTMSGTTVTLGTKNTVYAGTSPFTVVAASNSSSAPRTIAIAYRGASNVPLAVVGTTGYSETTSNLSASLFIGAADGSYTNGQTARVLVKGAVSTAQSGLTVNSTYYLQSNGTLSTTAGSPSVLAGRALAADKILIGAT